LVGELAHGVQFLFGDGQSALQAGDFAKPTEGSASASDMLVDTRSSKISGARAERYLVRR
jgi:hypothetical protein